MGTVTGCWPLAVWIDQIRLNERFRLASSYNIRFLYEAV